MLSWFIRHPAKGLVVFVWQETKLARIFKS